MTVLSTLSRIALAVALAAAATLAAAQVFPIKPVKIIVGFPAGGPLDAHARLLADRLGQLLVQPVIIDYKAGAGGTVGADFVAKSEADGYTLLMANTGTMVINPAIYTKSPYQTLRDFAPVVQVMAESIPQAAQYVKAGKLRALAVTSRERNPALPEVPTMIEAGIPGFEVVGFYGVLAPAGKPRLVVERLSAAFKATLESPEVRSKRVTQGADPALLGADDFARFLATEMPRWAQVVKDSGAKLD